jgi:hypothetical protein
MMVFIVIVKMVLQDVTAMMTVAEVLEWMNVATARVEIQGRVTITQRMIVGNVTEMVWVSVTIIQIAGMA